MLIIKILKKKIVIKKLNLTIASFEKANKKELPQKRKNEENGFYHQKPARSQSFNMCKSQLMVT